MRKSWSDDEIALLRKYNADGVSAYGTAQLLGRPLSSICTAAKRLGLSWIDRPVPAAARADEQQTRDVRAAVLSGLWREGLAILTRVQSAQEQGFQDLVKGQYGAEVTDVMPYVPSRSLSALAKAAADLVRTAAQVEAAQQKSTESSEIDEWITMMKGGNGNASSSDEGVPGEHRGDLAIPGAPEGS